MEGLEGCCDFLGGKRGGEKKQELKEHPSRRASKDFGGTWSNQNFTTEDIASFKPASELMKSNDSWMLED